MSYVQHLLSARDTVQHECAERPWTHLTRDSPSLAREKSEGLLVTFLQPMHIHTSTPPIRCQLQEAPHLAHIGMFPSRLTC